MYLSRETLKALDRLAALAHAKGVDVSHVNKRGGSSSLRVAVERTDGSITRRLIAPDGTISKYR